MEYLPKSEQIFSEREQNFSPWQMGLYFECVGPGKGMIAPWGARKQGGVLCLFFQPSLDIFSKII